MAGWRARPGPGPGGGDRPGAKPPGPGSGRARQPATADCFVYILYIFCIYFGIFWYILYINCYKLLEIAINCYKLHIVILNQLCIDFHSKLLTCNYIQMYKMQCQYTVSNLNIEFSIHIIELH